MLIQGRVGTQTVADGNYAPLRQDNFGALLSSQMGGKYQELVKRGLVFLSANQAARAVSLLSATCTGLCLSNSPGSTVNLVVLVVCVGIATAPAGAATLSLAAGTLSTTAVTHTTPETVRNAFIGNTSTGQGLVDRAATLPAAPVIVRALTGPVAASSISPPYIRDDVDGAIILAPGTSLSLSADTTAVSTIASIMWAELPV